MKYKPLTYSIFLFVSLFVFFNEYARYHFYYVEQNQLVQLTYDYFFDKLAAPGGFVELAGGYLTQFFLLPYAGALITSLLLTLTAVVVGMVIKRISHSYAWCALSLLPMTVLLFIHFSFNYSLSGTIAYLIAVLFFYLYTRIDSPSRRFFCGVSLFPFFFWLVGSAMLLFAVSVLLYELLTRKWHWFLCIFVLLEVLCIGAGSVWISFIGEFRYAYLPDAYFSHKLPPPSIIYASWLLFPFLIAFSYWAGRALTNRRIVIPVVVQFCLVGLLLWWGLPRYMDGDDARLKEIDYYAYHEQWDEVIRRCEGKLTNYLYICHLNRALAEKGELVNKLFHCDQRGVLGLVVPWNKAAHVSSLLSDVYYTIGNMASAQEMAFEAYVSFLPDGNPRMLQRLVETNLIYGEYAVAEKYINILSNTLFYQDWAERRRSYLYNDAAVNSDERLGMKRKLLLRESSLSLIDGLDTDLRLLAERCPSYTIPLQYLFSYYLLKKDLNAFMDLLSSYYSTDQRPSLPTSFQEAVIVSSERDSDCWARFNISEPIIRRFEDYKRQVLAYKDNQEAARVLLSRAYGNTYWFYYMYK